MSAKSRTRPRSRRTKAKNVRYNYDSTTDSDNDSSQREPSRRSRRIQSYLEDSSDNESESDLESLHSSDPSQQPRVRKPRYQPPPTRSKTSKRKRPSQPAKPKNDFHLFKKRKPNSSGVPTKKKFIIDVPPSGIIPPWQTLPYQVLQQIMKYAAYPLYEKASRTNPSIEWLCAVSKLCRSFHEACIAALLHSPPLYPAFRAHGLLHLLSKDQSKTVINYENKIRCLDIEVKNLLIRKSGIDIVDLLGHTPLLERLRLYHNHDDLDNITWAQPSHAKGRKYTYPDALFQKLDDTSIKLKSWEWNGRFPDGTTVLHTINAIHARPSFSELRDLSFLNISLPDKSTDADIDLANDLLVTALHRVPNLSSLIFRNCSILNAITMSQLPPSLTTLSIANCQYLTSELLSIYLSTSGTSLTTLTLTGNQSMSLAFLTNLSTLCPHLQHLNLDLTYTDPSSYRDRDPLYDEALPDGPPSWPSSLVSINIENLRQITLAEAEAFLTSLVNAAPELEGLRRIEMKIIVKDASWRDRAEIRKKWIPKLEDVFLDTSVPERRVHVHEKTKAKAAKTEKEVREMKEREGKTKIMEDAAKEEERRPSGRQSSRIAHLKQLSLSLSDTNDSDTNSYAGPSSMFDTMTRAGAGDTSFSDDDESTGKAVWQRRCDTVTLLLSDQRPAMEQYHEADFLDSERSGDEEWVGRDLVFN
jgi:hypothetical protein